MIFSKTKIEQNPQITIQGILFEVHNHNLLGAAFGLVFLLLLAIAAVISNFDSHTVKIFRVSPTHNENVNHRDLFPFHVRRPRATLA